MGTRSWIMWTPDLSIGVAKVDEQHQGLIRKFNELADAVFDGKGKEEIGNILHFLADYTVTHFRDEEALQELFGYPEAHRHKLIHDQFVSEVQTMITRFEAGELDSDLVVKTVNAVGAWILNHIKKEDMEIGKYLKTKRSEAESKPQGAPLGATAAERDIRQPVAAPPPEKPAAPSAPYAEPPKKKGVVRRFFAWLY